MSTIYLISSNYEFLHETYVGSTKDFKSRMRNHKYCYHNENSRDYNKPLYQFIRENGGWRAWKMTIIDSLTTTDKHEMLKCERRYVEEQEISLNKLIPSRTLKQYKLDHKEEINEKQKQYYQDNRETINKKQLEKVQCERCGAFSTRSNLRAHQKSKKCMNSHI